jgi:hypothetical protein
MQQVHHVSRQTAPQRHRASGGWYTPARTRWTFFNSPARSPQWLGSRVDRWATGAPSRAANSSCVSMCTCLCAHVMQDARVIAMLAQLSSRDQLNKVRLEWVAQSCPSSESQPLLLLPVLRRTRSWDSTPPAFLHTFTWSGKTRVQPPGESLTASLGGALRIPMAGLSSRCGPRSAGSRSHCGAPASCTLGRLWCSGVLRSAPCTCVLVFWLGRLAICCTVAHRPRRPPSPPPPRFLPSPGAPHAPPIRTHTHARLRMR